jgi:hypothetical protein
MFSLYIKGLEQQQRGACHQSIRRLRKVISGISTKKGVEEYLSGQAGRQEHSDCSDGKLRERETVRCRRFL